MVVYFLCMCNVVLRNRSILYPACVVFAMCIAILIGWIGIDFGDHWDEHFHLVYRFGQWLPPDYGYPPMTYTISHRVIATHLGAKAVELRARDGGSWRREYDRHAADPRVRDRLRLRSRTACMVVSQLVVAGVFIIVAGAWGWAEAALACVILSFSNEFLYHSRWVVPDTLHAFWSTLTMAVTLLAFRRNSFRALCGAAALAGATVATKYTSVFLACPLLACCLMLPRDGTRHAMRRCALLLAVMAGVFLMLCPGIVIENRKFWRTLMPVYQSYTKGHGGYNVAPGLSNLWLSVLYISTQWFSGVMAFNIAFFALAVWGAASWCRRRTREAALILLYLVFYVGFLSAHAIMIARNLMPVIPFLAVFAARGIFRCRALLVPVGKRVFSLAVLAAIATAATLEMRDAVEILRFARDDDYPVRSAREYLAADTAHRYYIHEKIRGRLLEMGALPANVVDDPARADFVLAFAPYLPNNIENSPFVIRRWFGTREVNLRYYSIWQQDVWWGTMRNKPNPIILLPRDAARHGLL